MPRSHHKTPTYRQHSSGLAVVTLPDVATGRRRDFMLGEFNSPESRARYHELIAAWEQRGRRLPDSPAAPTQARAVSVNEALELFYDDMQRRCRKPSGEPTGTAPDFAITIDYLRRLFGQMPLAEFGADQLERLRDELIKDGRNCNQTNKRIAHTRQWFNWSLARRLVPSHVDAYRTLLEMRQRVRPVRAGEYGAKPGKKVLPADPKAVEAALKFMPPAAKAICQLLRLTGARPDEICSMRPCELDRSGPTWQLKPEWHKCAKRGKTRVIYFGREAQAVLSPWLLGTGPDEFTFTAQKSEARRLAALREGRKTPLWQSHLQAQDRKRRANPKRKPGNRFTPRSLYHSILRACQHAGVRRFSPYQLRHLVATEVRTKLGLEHCRALLGHSAASMSDHYSESADGALAEQAALAIG